MRSLLIVTHIDFWRMGSGHRARLSALLGYLKDKLEITIVYAGSFTEQDRLVLKKLYPEVVIDALEEKRNLTYKEYSIKFGLYIKEKVFDAVLVEYIEMSVVLPFIQPGTITFLDTHDLVSHRIESFRVNNVPYDGINLTDDEEAEIFNCYDQVILIQKSDYLKVSTVMEEDRILLVPHHVAFPKKEIRETVTNIGFVASAYAPNTDAISWFLNQVWPLMHRYNIQFNIFGSVCTTLSPDVLSRSPGVILHGFVNDVELIYEQCDVMVNPVRCGAGLKIKNVEALGNGLPLITTSHGAIGMEDGANTAFLLADTPAEFEGWMEKLLLDYEFRFQLAEGSYQYAQQNFSADRCYTPFLHVIDRLNVLK